MHPMHSNMATSRSADHLDSQWYVTAFVPVDDVVGMQMCQGL